MTDHPNVTAEELYPFIVANAEEIHGQLVCRASQMAELRRQCVQFPGRVRKRLVKELTERRLVLHGNRDRRSRNGRDQNPLAGCSRTRARGSSSDNAGHGA
jgi:hypothetical protein